LEFLSLLDTSVTDAGIAVLAEAVSLQQISISSTVLTDACMPTLCRLPALVRLLIHDAPGITDKGISQLKKRSSLRELYLHGTRLSDRGVSSFCHLKPIWSLGLDRTHVADRGVSQLAPLCNLDLLSLEGTGVVGHGLCDLQTPPTDVYLDGCPVTDEAVQRIAKHIRGLRHLSLKDTPITNGCLPALARLKKLEMLRLTGTAVSDDGVACFRGHPSLGRLEVCETRVSRTEEQRLERLSPVEGMLVIR
jgi:hypothetical protein